MNLNLDPVLCEENLSLEEGNRFGSEDFVRIGLN